MKESIHHQHLEFFHFFFLGLNSRLRALLAHAKGCNSHQPPSTHFLRALLARPRRKQLNSIPALTLSYDQALNRAASLCSQGEKCSSDIFDKVLSWGIPEAEAARLVAYLIDEKFIDDTRFAHAFVNDKFIYQHWGRIKIRYTLRQKGIEDSVIGQMLEEVIEPEAYVEACADALRPKLRGMEAPLATNDRARLYRFAAQRGFEPSVISQALHTLVDDAEPDE